MSNIVASGLLAGVDVRILTSQTVPAVRVPQTSVAVCRRCGTSWSLVTDRHGVTRRAAGAATKRKAWRKCPNGCNAHRLGK